MFSSAINYLPFVFFFQVSDVFMLTRLVLGGDSWWCK